MNKGSTFSPALIIGGIFSKISCCPSECDAIGSPFDQEDWTTRYFIRLHTLLVVLLYLVANRYFHALVLRIVQEGTVKQESQYITSI